MSSTNYVLCRQALGLPVDDIGLQTGVLIKLLFNLMIKIQLKSKKMSFSVEAGSPYLAAPSQSKTVDWFETLTNWALKLATLISVIKWILIPLFV